MNSAVEITDEALMQRVKAGDHGAFSVLVQRHSQRFYACAFRMCHNPELSEDVVQEAFLKLWQRPEIWDADKGAKFTTWFYRVVTNQAIDARRKIKSSEGSNILDLMADDNADQHQDLEVLQQQEQIERAISDLPERQKTALSLCFYEGMSNREAAEVMDVGVKALESLLMRAKAGLRDVLIREKESKYG